MLATPKLFFMLNSCKSQNHQIIFYTSKIHQINCIPISNLKARHLRPYKLFPNPHSHFQRSKKGKLNEIARSNLLKLIVNYPKKRK